MKRALTLLFFVCCAEICFSQMPDIDKMLPVIAAEKNDSTKARLVFDCLGSSETDPVLDLQISEKLLEQAQRNNDPVTEVFALASLGYDYRLFGDHTKSWKYGLLAMAAAEKIPSPEAKAIANLVMALNYGNTSDYPRAIKFFTAAIDYSTQSKFDKLLCACYANLGELYLRTNKIDSALMYSQRGYELSTQIKYHDYLGPLLEQLGSIHAKLGNSKLAVSFYDLAVEEGYKMGSPKFINSSFTALAQYYYTQQPDSAVFYARKAIEAVEHTPFKNFSLTASKLLLDFYRYKNVDSAFKYSEIYRIANDSLFNAKTIQQTQLMAFEENIRQQQLIEAAEKEEQQNKKNIELALVALGIITFIILFMVISRSIITHAKMIEFLGVLALLLVFEFVNLLLHPFLEKKTDHSPSLMLLALVCIAAVLIPLHHRIEKWATSRLIENNKANRLAKARKTIETLEEKRLEEGKG